MVHFFVFYATSGRISGLNDEVKEVKASLFKALADKKQLQKKLNDLEKVSNLFFFSSSLTPKNIDRWGEVK